MNRDEKNAAFEKWFQSYIRSHEVSNPAKKKEISRWAFWAGMEFIQRKMKQETEREQYK